ncbi:MAG: glycosyltransferase [Thaumarchaeota archaeon]|nr:glycosyltransferase [Nitrososphaerota archaeon]
MKIAIIHYDISMRTGAQRLVLGLGSSLKNVGHDVAYFTAFYDPKTSFEEFKKETVFASGGRKTFFGMFRAIAAYQTSKKMMQYCLSKYRPDLFVFSSSYYLAHMYRPSIIYCHHPEKYLVKKGDNLRRILHLLIDRAEKRGFEGGDVVTCNSGFTLDAIKRAFSRDGIIAYPGVDTMRFAYSENDEGFLLSVNRIMPNKNLELALDALAELKKSRDAVPLIIAGTVQRGFESYADVLKEKVRSKGLGNDVKILTNVSDKELLELYRNCSIFLYTPTGEHYGFGPVEAMASGKPVIASNIGGPSETILDGETGYVVEENPKEWATKISILISDANLRKKMGKKGRKRVEENYTWAAFQKNMEKAIDQIKAKTNTM